jgi:hypothetical protein
VKRSKILLPSLRRQECIGGRNAKSSKDCSKSAEDERNSPSDTTQILGLQPLARQAQPQSLLPVAAISRAERFFET